MGWDGVYHAYSWSGCDKLSCQILLLCVNGFLHGDMSFKNSGFLGARPSGRAGRTIKFTTSVGRSFL